MDEHLLRYNEDKTLVFIDCETLNLCLNSCHNLPWQVSMLKVQGDNSVAEKDYYIKWDTHLKISEGAARITRYSQSTVDKKGVKPEEAFPTVKDWLDNCDYILGHNTIGFDIYLIKDYYRAMGEDYKHLVDKFIDTNCIARGIKMGMKYTAGTDFLAYQYKVYHRRQKGIRTNMTSLGKEFDIEHDYDNLHNAIVDLKLNLKIWNKLKWQVDI